MVSSAFPTPESNSPHTDPTLRREAVHYYVASRGKASTEKGICAVHMASSIISHHGLIRQSHGLSSLESAPESWVLFDAENIGFFFFSEIYLFFIFS